MPRLLLQLAFLIILVLTITSFAARALGGTQPSNPALRGFTEGCEGIPQPCWYGIVPGVTSFTQLQSTMNKYGYALEGNSLRFTENRVDTGCMIKLIPGSMGDTFSDIWFLDCKGLRWGDLMRILGKPDWVYICNDYAPPKPSYGYLAGINVGIDDVNAGAFWATPLDNVHFINMFWRMGRYGDDFQPQNKWLGLMPIWKYFYARQGIYEQNCNGEG